MIGVVINPAKVAEVRILDGGTVPRWNRGVTPEGGVLFQPHFDVPVMVSGSFRNRASATQTISLERMMPPGTHDEIMAAPISPIIGVIVAKTGDEIRTASTVRIIGNTKSGRGIEEVGFRARHRCNQNRRNERPPDSFHVDLRSVLFDLNAGRYCNVPQNPLRRTIPYSAANGGEAASGNR